MVEWSLCCSQEQVESLCDALEDLHCLSASVEDADAHTDAEQPLFGEPGMPAPAEGWNHSRVRALFADDTKAQIARAFLAERSAQEGWQDLGIAPVPEQDWVTLTQSQFAPVHISGDFWIVPSWHTAPQSAQTVMRLDPGMAFGTGTHPTTRMCLQWLAAAASHDTIVSQSSTRVLDYGCGSGVLAIAAGLLAQRSGKALDIVAVDLDEAAVQATAQNAAKNGVELHSGDVSIVRGEFNIVLANILATPLKVLAPLLCARLAPNAQLVLAGILSRQAEELIEAYRPWVDLRVSDEQDGWILMTATKTAAHTP